jgi:prepilin peptidase CpaA
MSLPPPPVPAIRILLSLIVIPAAALDIKTRRIPNWLSLSGALLGIGLNAFLAEAFTTWEAGLWFSLEGLGLAFAIYFVLYLLHGMGAGDVKLMAAVGAVAGPGGWLWILVLTCLAGAVAGLLLIAAKGRFRKTLDNILLILISFRHGHLPYKANPQLDVRSREALRLPHAVMIAVGTLVAIWAPWAPR